jgi:hypothetical protein
MDLASNSLFKKICASIVRFQVSVVGVVGVFTCYGCMHGSDLTSNSDFLSDTCSQVTDK